MGEIKTVFQDEEKIPEVKDWLNKKYIGYEKIKRHSNRNFKDKLSGPEYTFKFTVLSSLNTSITCLNYLLCLMYFIR